MQTESECRIGAALSACEAILDVICDFLTNCRQLEMLLLDEGIVGHVGKLPITGSLVAQVIVPIHAGAADVGLLSYCQCSLIQHQL